MISSPICITSIWINYYLIYDSSGSLLNTMMFTDASPFKYVTVGDYAGDGSSEVAALTNNGDSWMAIFNPMASSWSSALLKSQCVGGDFCSYPASEDIFCSYDYTSAYAIKNDKISTKATTLETPTLIAPKDKKEDVQTLRPTFEWKHHKGNTTEYKIDIAKNESFNISPQTFTKSPNTGSPDKTDSALYYYNYSIHEFDPGLDPDTDYWWKVTAIASNEVATSEPWSFKIAPDLTLTGITNWPNPFNPNSSDPKMNKTNIRYRLGANADEVKIRIYDITGALVTEITNCPTGGELSSVWDKYHDVDWNGRNGRGDMVMNGIYPFEVTARLGDKSVSGRGKIAVLK